MSAAQHILIRNARVHNLQGLDLAIPLGQVVAIAGVSGSGKSSLALGVLYAEGSRRYLEALSTYTRRRITQAARPQVDEVLHIPAALALHQRPAIPGIRSTFGTGTELNNSLRLMFSRLAAHVCPNGHVHEPTLAVAAEQTLICPVCQAEFYAPSAEELAFNSQGACRTCQGTGRVLTVDETTLIPNPELTIDEGAVAPWRTLMWSLMTDVCRAMGVRTDVPFKELTDQEKEIVLHGPAEKRHILYRPKKQEGTSATELDFTFYNAVYTVQNALAKVTDEKGMKRVERFLKEEPCPDCHGSRLCAEARRPVLHGCTLDAACRMTLAELAEWTRGVPASLPEVMRPMARSICQSFHDTARRLLDLGLGYLSLDRASSTLSTGERQRMQLARAVRNRTTGVLYVLDEPSIGLHPANIKGLVDVLHDLVEDGNSVILVDHETEILRTADWFIEMGPGAGSRGGHVLCEGTLEEITQNPASLIGPFLKEEPGRGRGLSREELFEKGSLHLVTRPLHTVQGLDVRLPKGCLVAVSGVSGSGKTTLVLESLVPALQALVRKEALPAHVASLEADGIHQVRLIDASPIGINVRSTVATYANVHDELRKIFARTKAAREAGCKAGDFSYNTGKLRCPVCDGTGVISLDVQFLPDVEIACPECLGSRYARAAHEIRLEAGTGPSLPELMAMDIDTALDACKNLRLVRQRLQVLHDLGLGYLTLGEATPSLSGGEAQRLKLAESMGRAQDETVFVFDEPTIGLHPLDVQTLLKVFRHLLDMGATVVVIEHDLTVLRAADYVLDMGPGGGMDGGRLVACGTVEDIRNNPESVTGRYL